VNKDVAKSWNGNSGMPEPPVVDVLVLLDVVVGGT
jgi:hypothetical protein